MSDVSKKMGKGRRGSERRKYVFVSFKYRPIIHSQPLSPIGRLWGPLGLGEVCISPSHEMEGSG